MCNNIFINNIIHYYILYIIMNPDDINVNDSKYCEIINESTINNINNEVKNSNELITKPFDTDIIEVNSICQLVKYSNDHIGKRVSATLKKYQASENILREHGIKFLIYKSRTKLRFLGTGCRFPEKIAGIKAGVFKIKINKRNYAVKIEPKKEKTHVKYMQNLPIIFALSEIAPVLQCQYVAKIKYVIYVRYMNVWAIVMDRINGNRLRYEKYNNSISTNINKKLTTLRCILNGLKFFYKHNISYWDIKGDNFMFDKKGRGYIIDYDNTHKYRHDKDRKNKVHIHRFLNTAYELVVSGKHINSLDELVKLNIHPQLASLLFINRKQHLEKPRTGLNKHDKIIEHLEQKNVTWDYLLTLI
jgi:hypothetical protein